MRARAPPPPPCRAVPWRGEARRGERACVRACRGERACVRVVSCHVVSSWDVMWRDAWVSTFCLENKERVENQDLTVVWLKAIHCDWLQLNQTFALWPIYSLPVSFFPSAQSQHISPLLSSPCRVTLCSSPSRTSTCIEIERAGL
jgi:hypothetical protein